MSDRIRDFMIIIGHAWICTTCREKLLADPESTMIGHKLTETEREVLINLTDDSFSTMMELDRVTGLNLDELQAAVDHPRSRLRHLGIDRRR